MTTPANVEFRQLHIPADLRSPDAADFLAMVRVRNQVAREVTGHSDDQMAAEALLPHYAPNPYQTRMWWLALESGRPVGRIGLDLSEEGNSTVGSSRIELIADAHGRGIGSAALQLLEDSAHTRGRGTLQAEIEHPQAPGPRLAAPNGFGDIPLDRTARFLLGQGFNLEQVERNSVFDLTKDPAPLRKQLRTAAAAALGYEIVQWQPPTPAPFVTDYAWLKSRMSTDTPMAALLTEEEHWDAQRLTNEEQTVLASGQTCLVTAARHLASGRLVAFNELTIDTDPEGASHQWDTLVLAEHRGHRLGLLVKAAGLLRWREMFPRSPKVRTWNAEENRPMLRVNEALGFTPVSYAGIWQKRLATIAT